MKRLNRARGEDGAAAIEFIIVAPVMLAFTMACLQFAVIFFTYLGMLSTARDVTRWITVNPNTVDSTAVATVETHLPSDIDPTKLSITITPALPTISASPGRPVRTSTWQSATTSAACTSYRRRSAWREPRLSSSRQACHPTT